MTQVAVGKREALSIFGDDYPTTDGTCVRDYLHVVDLAVGHVKALEALVASPAGARAYNLGTGQGVSVLQIVKAFEAVTGQKVPYTVAPRRAGDLAAFWADATRAGEELGWQAAHTLEDMLADAWRWQSGNPDGYADASPAAKTDSSGKATEPALVA